MSSARLFVLGELARRGPMHGHQIRRAAEIDHLDLWTDVKPGSLYGALKRMDAEGLVRQVRVEQEGRRPPRRVYEITQDGRHELELRLEAALRKSGLIPDPIDLALGHVHGIPEDTARLALQDRQASLTHQLQSMLDLRAEAEPYLSAMEKQVFEHTLRRLRLEVDWHSELLEQLSSLMGAADASGRNVG